MEALKIEQYHTNADHEVSHECRLLAAAIGVVNHHFLLACRPSFVATQRRGLPGNKYRGFAELTLRCPSGVVTQRARDVSRPPKSEQLGRDVRVI